MYKNTDVNLYRMNQPLNVFHKLEVGSSLLDLLDGARGQLVDELAQDDAIFQDVLVRAVGEGLAGHLGDPLQHFLLLFLVSGLKCRELYK